MSLHETFSGLAHRYLSPRHFTALRSGYLGAAAKLAPVIKALYGTFDSRQLRDHLAQRIGREFEVLLVHSSVNGMQRAYVDTPLDLVRMLVEYCAPDRTLAMPAFYFGDPDIGGAGATFERKPRFDIRRTPSQMGLATELFRRSKGVVQSRNPIYRFSALGPLAEALTASHETAPTLCGAGTPFSFMDSHNTLILGIGKSFDVLTHVHHIEQLMGDAFPVPRTVGKPVDMILVDGKAEIPYRLPRYGLMWTLDMRKLRRIMPPQKLRVWSFHGVPFFAVYAHDVTSALMDAAGRGVTLYVKR